MNPPTKTTTLLGILIVLVIVAGLLLALSQTAREQRLLSIQSYEDCVHAGYPVMESYPSQCRTPDGRLFVNPHEVAPTLPQTQLIDASSSATTSAAITP